MRYADRERPERMNERTNERIPAPAAKEKDRWIERGDAERVQENRGKERGGRNTRGTEVEG